jgi:hypothetical protein
MVLDSCKSFLIIALLGHGPSFGNDERGALMGSDGFRAPYETYDNTTKYVFLLIPDLPILKLDRDGE